MFSRRWTSLGMGGAVVALVIVAAVVAANRAWITVGDRSPIPTDAGYQSDSSNQRPFVVLFIHGIFGSRNDTWRHQSDTFPALLASDPEFQPNVDVFVFEYFTPTFGSAASIVALADQLRGSLEDNRVLDNHKHLVVVGHSMGGLVARKLLLSRRDLIDRVKLLYLYASPTSGSELAARASYISANPQLRAMLPLSGNDFLESLRQDWISWDKAQLTPTHCAFETLDTGGVRVVTMESATALCNRSADPLTANHIDIVKPANRRDARYSRFATALREAIDRNRREREPARRFTEQMFRDPSGAISCPGSRTGTVAVRRGDRWNLALLNTATVTASGVVEGFKDYHQIPFLTDGQTGNCRSWVSKTVRGATIKIDLGEEHIVDEVVISSDATGQYDDRALHSGMTVWLGSDDERFAQMAQTGTRIVTEHSIRIRPAQRARYIELRSIAGDQEPRVDEVQVWGRPRDM